jgi:gamma-glutamyl:cysteine ligase YbdK (ATP-grasp superfamily)
MGRDIDTTEFSRDDRTRYREKVKANLAALRELIERGRFDTGRHRVGVEMEIYLTDADGNVMPINAKLLERIRSATFQTELAQFNIEFFTRPRRIQGDALRLIEQALRSSLDHANAQARSLGAQVMVIGILPTLTDFDVTEHNLSANPRYQALNDMILNARGEDIVIRIEGDEVLETTTNSILFEAACTSTQFHLQVDPEDFAAYWNAAQAAAAPEVALGANSPFFLGKQLHHETRIALFEQSIDTRTEELQQQGVRPRVWFGERWLSESIFELFDENVRYFPSLLPICEDEDPEEMLRQGGVPNLWELTLHNGTIYRWNRPIYDVARGTPHLRVENRVLPAGPTVLDVMANAAFYYGLTRALAQQDPPIWERLSFQSATENFFAAARHGLRARVYWPGIGADVPVSELIVRHLLPLARDGLRSWQVDEVDIDRYLGIAEERVLSGQNGAAWQIATYRRLVDHVELDRPAAARELVRRYQKQSEGGEPVHTWPVGG